MTTPDKPPHPGLGRPAVRARGDGLTTVVGAVIVAGGRVLAARRARPLALAGGWEFPGGKVEPGEEPADAVRREIAEELTVEVRVGAELSDGGRAWPISTAYELRLFAATIAGDGAPTAGTDHDELRWLAESELDQVAWLDADCQALPVVRAHLSG